METFYPEEFLSFSDDPESLTYKTAKLMGVDPKTFINWRWQMGAQFREAAQLSPYVELSGDEEEGFSQGKRLFHIGLTPYYFGLFAHGGDINGSIRRQALPSQQEMIDPIGQKDPLQEKGHSPTAEVVHVYNDRIAFCVAQLCPVYCRYCYRKRRDDESGLHFNRRIIDRGLEYIRSNRAIRDVLITGGDPFLASDGALVQLVKEIRAIKHVEIIRFGTRTPVTLPYRVTEALARALKPYHPIYINTHFNCVEEITPEARCALNNLVNHGFPVGNQAVLLRGVNDHPDKMLALCRALLTARVKPYYVFQAHLIEGTGHLRVPLKESLAIMKSLRGKITGMGIPRFIVDTPSGKIPMDHNYVLSQDGDDLIVENLHGEIWREKYVLGTPD